jgi:hypothetical protein
MRRFWKLLDVAQSVFASLPERLLSELVRLRCSFRSNRGRSRTRWKSPPCRRVRFESLECRVVLGAGDVYTFAPSFYTPANNTWTADPNVTNRDGAARAKHTFLGRKIIGK